MHQKARRAKAYQVLQNELLECKLSEIILHKQSDLNTAILNNVKRLKAEFKQAEEMVKGTEALVKTLTVFAAETVLNNFLGYVLRALIEQLKASSSGIWLYDKTFDTTILHINYEDKQLRQGEAIARPGASRDNILKQWDAEYMPLLKQKQILIQDVQECTPQLPECVQTWHYNKHQRIRSRIVIPLCSGDTFLGNITLRQTQQRDYKPEEIELARALAYQASLVIQLIQNQELSLKSGLELSGASSWLHNQTIAKANSIHLLQYYSLQKHTQSEYPNGLPKRKLWQVIDYINEHLDQDLSLAELAQFVEISVYHFSRMFKQSTGFSPHPYIIQCRVERARQLLLKGELTIAQVAFSVGFANQGHLNRHFKRLFGVTPKAIRQNSKNG